MDTKLFVFMVLFLTFLTNYSTAHKNDNSSLIKGNSYRRGSRHSKEHHKTTHGKRNRPIKHNDNPNLRNVESNQSENTEDIPKTSIGTIYDDKVTPMMRGLAEESDPKSIKRGGRDYNYDDTDTSALESYSTDVTTDGGETPTQPQQQRTRKAKRRMKKKQNKKYRPKFKITKIKNRKHNNENKPKPDIPDKAEDILDESQEVYSERIHPNNRKLKGKKAFRKLYNNIGKNKGRNRDVTGGSKKPQFRKKKAGKTKTQKKKHNWIHSTTQNTEDILEKIISDEVEETTKHMHKANYEKTEIIYLTPILHHRKYKPEFRYIPIDNEPMNYGSSYNLNADMDHSHESDKSKSTSNETEEIDSNQKKTTNWAETYKLTNGQEDNDDDDGAADTAENNESKETEDLDHDHDSLKIRRSAEEKWDDLESEHVKYRNNINDYKSIKKSNFISNKLRKGQNYHKKKTDQHVEGQEDKTVSPNEDDKEAHTIKTTDQHVEGQEDKTVSPNEDDKEAHTMKKINQHVEEQDDNTVSPNDDIKEAHRMKMKSHFDILEDRSAPVLQYAKKEDDDDIPQEELFTKSSTLHDNIVLITFEEDHTGQYEPAVLYNEKYKRMLEKFFGKRSTPSTFAEDTRPSYRLTPKHSKQYDTIYKEIFAHGPITHEPLPTVMVTEEPKGRYDPVMEYIPKINYGAVQIQDEEVTRGIFTDQSIERLEPALEYNKGYDGSSEERVKRSTQHESVKVVKIIHGGYNKKKKKKSRQKVILTTNQPLETTTNEDYDETNTGPDKETEKPSYQVNENVIDIPDTRPIPGPIVPDYVIESDQKITPTFNMSNNINVYNPLNIQTDNENTEHPIVNIVHGMKDYFTVIGRGLYNTVKDIFKEQRRRRRSIESQENNYVNIRY